MLGKHHLLVYSAGFHTALISHANLTRYSHTTSTYLRRASKRPFKLLEVHVNYPPSNIYWLSM